MNFKWIHITEVPYDLITGFDSGNESFNSFLKEKSIEWSSAGESVTYVCVDEEERQQGALKRILGYAAINTMGLQYSLDNRCKYLSCVEIRMFAIAKQLRKRHDPTILWSSTIFKSILQLLYEMSTKTIGFKAIFLNANPDGYQLYKDCGFDEITDYISPEEDDKIEIEDCRPMLLTINDDMLYKIFL